MDLHLPLGTPQEVEYAIPLVVEENAANGETDVGTIKKRGGSGANFLLYGVIGALFGADPLSGLEHNISNTRGETGMAHLCGSHDCSRRHGYPFVVLDFKASGSRERRRSGWVGKILYDIVSHFTNLLRNCSTHPHHTGIHIASGLA